MGMKPRRRRWRWVTRDLPHKLLIWELSVEPRADEGGYINCPGSAHFSIGVEEFKLLFGYVLPIYTAARIEFSARHSRNIAWEGSS